MAVSGAGIASVARCTMPSDQARREASGQSRHGAGQGEDRGFVGFIGRRGGAAGGGGCRGAGAPRR
jgi:hypothetical protein